MENLEEMSKHPRCCPLLHKGMCDKMQPTCGQPTTVRFFESRNYVIGKKVIGLWSTMSSWTWYVPPLRLSLCWLTQYHKARSRTCKDTGGANEMVLPSHILRVIHA